MQLFANLNLRASILALTVANLAPLIGVIYFSWDASFIILLYWVENLIIGFYNLLKMALLHTGHSVTKLRKAFSMLFFGIHFGGFCVGHGVFLILFLKIGPENPSFFPESPWPIFLVFFQILFSVISTLWAQHPPGMEFTVIALILSHGTSFIRNYYLGGEYKNMNLHQLMAQPYKRIMTMHITIIAGGFLIAFLNSPLALIIILVFMKTLMDIHLHQKEHSFSKNNNETETNANI